MTQIERKEKRCPFPNCGKPYLYTPHKLPENEEIPLWTPQCTCKADMIKADLAKEEASGAFHLYEKYRATCLIPQWCMDKTWDIPRDPVKVADELTGEWKILLEYDKFHLYLADLKENINHGLSIFCPGNVGTRKTTYICEIGKQVLRLGKSVRYYTASSIIADKVPWWELIYNVDFLIIDDLGMSSIEKKGNHLFDIHNKRLDRNKATAIITNNTEEQNRGIHGDAFMDRLKLFYTIFMIGDSSRTFDEKKLERGNA
jgi:hypothetical protein